MMQQLDRSERTTERSGPLLGVFLDRVELVWTAMMDLAMIIVVAGAAWLTQIVLAFLLPGDGQSRAITGVRFITDVAMVGTVAVIATFDLAKRLVQGVRRFQKALHD